MGAKLDDYKVTIGNESCIVVEVSFHEVVCEPPYNEQNSRLDMDSKPIVMVSEYTLHISSMKRVMLFAQIPYKTAK